MATTMTLAQFRTAVRQRADIENATGVYTDSFITDDELNSYINQSIYELYDILIQAFGNDYFVADPYSVTTDGSNDTFVLPSDFYKLIGVACQIQGNQNFLPLKQGSVSDLLALSGIADQSLAGLNTMIYRLRANKIWLAPRPNNGQVIRLLYVPRFEELTSDSATFDGISGWTEYVIVDAAIKCMQKEESDVQVLMAQKAALLVRIQSSVTNRDAANPSQVTDTQSNSSIFGGNFGGGWWDA